jgi:hypothetical protein
LNITHTRAGRTRYTADEHDSWNIRNSNAATPKIFPPPSEVLQDCEVCADDFYTPKLQLKAKSITGRYRPTYGGSFENDEEAPSALDEVLVMITKHSEHLEDLKVCSNRTGTFSFPVGQIQA